MLGHDVCEALARTGNEVVATARQGGAVCLDVAETTDCFQIIGQERPDAVIHCAAYTNVDGAESDSLSAYRVNALGSWNLAAACAEFGVSLCAISTDFVFDGAKKEPYTEFDAPHPLGVYGASKLAGENAIRAIWRKHWIVRTSWLFGLHGKSFPNTILRAAETRPELRIIADQHGTPTYTRDLAESVVHLLDNPLYGTYHLANTGVTSWYDFARTALEMTGNTQTRVIPILSSEWPSPTQRPLYSPLRSYALELQGAAVLRPWQGALTDYLIERNAKS